MYHTDIMEEPTLSWQVTCRDRVSSCITVLVVVYRFLLQKKLPACMEK